ncbi:zinc finger BED domain-containing protein 1-like [Huso huso]|uniref:Zinc finger BED domain-containing protein 1-like n=1 Tax=Huso huso TaxID=61971 RepID=A0ABR0ZW78_HUSHU
MKKAFTELLGLHAVWLNCFGHNLNLAIGKALKLNRIETAVRACWQIVQGFNRSWKRRRELIKKQPDLNVPQHTLIHDVVTRWGSTYSMVSQFIEQQQAVFAALACDRSTWHLMPRDTNIATLEDVCKGLGMLNTFTDSLAAESYVTISALKPILHHLTNDLLTEETNDSELAKHMKAAIKDDLIARYSTDNIKKLIDIACFLDPRFKDSFSENVEDITAITANEAVVTATVKLSQQEVPTGTENAAQGSTGEGSAPGSLCQLLQNITTKQQQLQRNCAEVDDSNETRARSEVSRYLALPQITAEKDPLMWWNTHAADL